jgi:coenzyme F420-0:L-glutamate ligase / coenzyme F420-1:gamma-L-glutamate ligase
VNRLELVGVEGIGEVTAGADLAGLVVAALDAADEGLRDGDVVVVSSKVVSKAEGRSLAAPSREDAVAAETVRVVAERIGPRGLTRIVQSRSGPVLAAAGVDASNVDPGTVLLLPADPDRSARTLRTALTRATGALVGVVISDTAGRAWRDGQVDLAIGAAGLRVTDDLRGGTDPYGNPLEATVRALADELAGAADLVKGKLRAVPVAIVRGLADLVTADDGPGAATLLRGPGSDWFALGHVEAVRTALGAPPGTPGVDPTPMVPDGVEARLRRAVAVTLAGPDPFGGTVTIRRPGDQQRDGATVVVDASAGPLAVLTLGAAVQRLVAAAWAEGLRLTVATEDRAVTLVARLSPH